MRKLVILAVAILPLAGCAQVIAARDFLSDPKTVEATAVAKGWSQIVACSVNNAASIAGQIESAVNAGKAVQDTTGRVYTVSSIVCSALGGTPGATTKVAAN